MYKIADNVALVLNVNAERPLQAQLFEQVRAMIIDGQLKAGTALPATRALSERLGVSRNTVVLAYDRLLAEGYIESKRSIGTFVSTVIPDSGLMKADNDHAPLPVDETAAEAEGAALDIVLERHADVFGEANFAPHHAVQNAGVAIETGTQLPEIDFRPFHMDSEDFPIRSWRRILNRKSQDVERFFHPVIDPLGDFDLRRAIADHLGPARGIIADADEVMIFNNSAEARLLLAELLLAQDVPAVCESPASASMIRLFSHKGAKLYHIPVDGQGLMTEQLPVLHENDKGGLLYLSPCCQVPLGVAMPLARRIELLEWARSARLMVIEDEADSDFYQSSSPPTALKGLDGRGKVIYLGGFEKALGPSFSLAYIVLPKKLVSLASRLKSMLLPPPSFLNQAVLAEFVECGAYDRHLRKFRKKCMEKRKFLIDQLNSRFSHLPSYRDTGGLQLLFPLPKGVEVSELLHRTHSDDLLGLYTLPQCGFHIGSAETDETKTDDTKNDFAQSLLLGFSGVEMSDISRGVEQLAVLINEIDKPRLAVNGDMR